MRDLDPDVEERNTAKRALTEDEVLELVRLAGGVAPLLSTRSAAVKERGWTTSPPDAETFARAVAEDVNLLRRPILMVGEQVIVGKDPAAYRSALG